MASIDGLTTGLNTTEIISQLMRLERQPQAKLQTRQATVESAISTLRGLNTRFLAVTAAAAKLGAGPSTTSPTAWQSVRATSSDPTRVAANAAPGTAQGSLTFSVEKLATATAYLSTGHVTDPAAAGGVVAANSTIWVTKGASGDPVEIATGDGSLNAVVSAINKAGAGVAASTVQLASGQYQLQLASTTTGADTAIKVGTTAGADGAFDATLTGMTVKQAGQDAELTVFGQVVTRPTNSISDVLQGVTMTLAKADPGVAVTVSVANDPEAVASQVQALVDAINTVKSDIKASTGYNLETKSKGRLYGDSTIRSLHDRLSTAVIGDGTASAGVLGVSVARDGTVSFDKAKFLKALAEDPAQVERVLGKDGLAGRVHELADAASRRATAERGPGLITNAISNRERQVATLKTDISNWDNRLSLREKSLQRQYAGLETAMGAAQRQGQWLAGQLAGLPSWGN